MVWWVYPLPSPPAKGLTWTRSGWVYPGTLVRPLSFFGVGGGYHCSLVARAAAHAVADFDAALLLNERHLLGEPPGTPPGWGSNLGKLEPHIFGEGGGIRSRLPAPWGPGSERR